ncbi:MAG TPA: hypothetical protein VN937_15500 [Blastocatellia bacterium]|nr:hypothetical protein [Blastocatellia bacterium]
MKNRNVLLCALLVFIAAAGDTTRAQSPDKFVKKTSKYYWRDQNRQPWSDTSYEMAVRIDPQYAPALGAQEISDNDPVQPLKYAVGEFRRFGLKKDGQGTYADVEFLVYENKSDPVIYQVELQKNGRALPMLTPSKVEVSNDTPDRQTGEVKENNTLFLKDWMIVAAVMLGGALLIYILLFRALFSGLLFRRRWGVSSAEHFTWSMSLLAILGLAAGMTLLYLGPRLEAWVIIAVMGAFWLLHAFVWLISGKEA